MQSEENIKILEKFFKGEASISEVHYLLVLLKKPEVLDDHIDNLWEQAAYSQDPEVSDRMFQTISRHTKQSKKSYLYKSYIWAACILFFIVTGSLSFLLYQNANIFDEVVFCVENGQKASLTLPDGTFVQLNSGSVIKYGHSFNRNKRIVELDGEAFFEIRGMKNCPFIVQCENTTVEALGTTFNVKAYSEDETVEVVLTTGKVRFSIENSSMELLPGDYTEYHKKEQNIKKTHLVDYSPLLCWRNNEFVYENESLEKIISNLSRHYNVEFVFNDEIVKEFRFSGTLPNNSLLSVLDIFSLSAPISYTIKDARITLEENSSTKKYFKEITSINSK